MSERRNRLEEIVDADPGMAARLLGEAYNVVRAVQKYGDWGAVYYDDAVGLWERLGDFLYPAPVVPEAEADASLYGVCWCGRARGVRTVLEADTPKHPADPAPLPHAVYSELVCPVHGVECSW